MRTRNGIIAIMTASLLAVIAVAFMHHFVRHSDAASPKTVSAPAGIRVVIARRGDFLERVTAQGRIGPPAGSSVNVSFPQAGILRAVDVTLGEKISTGQPLAELDRSALAVAVTQAKADVLVAGGSYEGGNNRIVTRSAVRQAALKVEADLRAVARDEVLLRGGVLAEKDAEAARTQLAADQAERQAVDARASETRAQAASADAKLAAARISYANGIVRAPADGVVLAVLKRPGEAVDPSTPVLAIGPPDAHLASLSVPADLARRIHAGDTADLQIPRASERAIHCQVSVVVPVVDPATQVVTVILKNVPVDAVSGDAIAASIVVSRLNGILVPSSAIIQDPQTGKNVVFVRNAHAKPGDAPFEMRVVRVLASDAKTAVVASGLRSGEGVAAQGGYALLAPSGG